MKLAIIYTGGTISCQIEIGSFSPSAKTKSELTKALDDSIEVESFQPYYTLSEQLNGEHISLLIECVAERLKGDFDGIIVTHGTDTLQYSAAALSIAFADSKTPIVLVSSNYILSDSRANGFSNFKYAVEFIKQKIGGVFVSYKNENCNSEIFLGDSLLPHLPYSDKLNAIGTAFGYFSNEKFIRLIDNFNTKSEGKFRLTKKSPVLWLKAYAGMKYPELDGYKAVLLESYHSGTLPSEDEDFIKFCKNSPVPIHIIGMVDGTQYESTKIFKQLNVVVHKNLNPIYVYISLWREL